VKEFIKISMNISQMVIRGNRIYNKSIKFFDSIKLFLKNRPNCTTNQLGKYLNRSNRRVLEAMDGLLDLGLVTKKRYGGNVHWQLKTP